MTSDLVYIYRKPDDETELRYSLRSVAQHLAHGKVFIVGDKSDVVSDAVTWIPCKAPDTPYQNACVKLLKAADTAAVSERFILMNDDFFVLQKQNDVDSFFDGTLAELLKKIPQERLGAYSQSIKDTIKITGGNALNFGLHVPFPMEKTKLRDLARDHALPREPLQLRSLYAWANAVKGRRLSDVKVRKPADLKALAAGTFLSTDDGFSRQRMFRDFIVNRFPRPCRYER